jgi:hypothetical protein
VIFKFEPLADDPMGVVSKSLEFESEPMKERRFVAVSSGPRDLMEVLRMLLDPGGKASYISVCVTRRLERLEKVPVLVRPQNVVLMIDERHRERETQLFIEQRLYRTKMRDLWPWVRRPFRRSH